MSSERGEGSSQHAKFTQLPAHQIEKLRDSFQLIDQDNDSTISKADLEKTYGSLSQKKSSDQLEEMLGSGEMSFTAYLSLLSNELSQLPNKAEIQKAIQVFSQDTEINARELQEGLISVGMSKEEIAPVLNSFKTERMNGDQVFLGQEFLNYVSS